jgi:hypothetical protein
MTLNFAAQLSPFSRSVYTALQRLVPCVVEEVYPILRLV